METETAPTLADLRAEFVEQMKADGFADQTIYNYGRAVDLFREFLAERGIGSLAELTKPLMKDFRAFLHRYRARRDGRALAARTVADRIIGLRAFFRAMLAKGRVLYDFSSALEVPVVPKRVPRVILTQSEVALILSLPDTTAALGYRNRAILEVLYATGIRNAELRDLKIDDVNLEQGEIRVNCGKGGVDRIVPLPRETADLVGEYMAKVRPLLAAHEDKRPIMRGSPTGGAWLFLGRFGNRLNEDGIWFIVKKYAAESGIEKAISCHVFRHSIATHLLENGMDIRYIQALLGHRSLESTQIYTRVAVRDLRRAYRRFHPRERRGRLGESAEESGSLG